MICCRESTGVVSGLRSEVSTEDTGEACKVRRNLKALVTLDRIWGPIDLTHHSLPGQL